MPVPLASPAVSPAALMTYAIATVYQDGKPLRSGPLTRSMPRAGPREFIWIELADPTESDFAIIQQRFKLHGLAVDSSMAPVRVPKLDLYDDQIFVVLNGAWLEGDAIRYESVEAFVSSHHIITVEHGESAARLYSGQTPGARVPTGHVQPDFVLHALIDLVVECYFPLIQMIEDEVLSMEQQLAGGFLGRDDVTRLFRLRREAIQFQHVLARTSDICGKLTNLDLPCVTAEARPYFRDVQDHLVRLNATTSALVDVIRSVFEASNLLEQQRQGAITRQLAAWAAIVGVPSAIAGIYGMNFAAMPGADQRYGFAVAVGMMIVLCIGLYVRFRTLQWL